MGLKTLPTIWGTYMKLVTKYQISTINSGWEKCDEKYLGRTDSGKTVYPPPSSGSRGINTTTVPAEGNSSKRPIVFNNCQVTNNKKKNIPENDKQKVLFI
jgi:hypothetical protein